MIDYLSLDIEGAEWWVFEEFPWGDYTFLSLTVERPKPPLREALRSHEYVFLCMNGYDGDEFWIHRTHPHFEAALKKFGTEKEPEVGAVLNFEDSCQFKYDREAKRGAKSYLLEQPSVR